MPPIRPSCHDRRHRRADGMEVTASTDGALPSDDITTPTSLLELGSGSRGRATGAARGATPR
jgi:hypothetical protein